MNKKQPLEAEPTLLDLTDDLEKQVEALEILVFKKLDQQKSHRQKLDRQKLDPKNLEIDNVDTDNLDLDAFKKAAASRPQKKR